MLGANGPDAAKDFELEKFISKEMLDAYDISSAITRIGLIVYGRDARVVAGLNSYSDRSSLENVINSLRNPGDGSRVDKALNIARTNLFLESNGARNAIPKTLVVFLNRKADISPLAEANKLREHGVKIIPVGIGKKIDQDDIISLSESSDNIFAARDPTEAMKTAAGASKATFPGTSTSTFSKSDIHVAKSWSTVGFS